jgi:hypothetical protein
VKCLKTVHQSWKETMEQFGSLDSYTCKWHCVDTQWQTTLGITSTCTCTNTTSLINLILYANKGARLGADLAQVAFFSFKLIESVCMFSSHTNKELCHQLD